MDINFLSADFWEKAGVKDVQDELDKGAEVNARGKGGWTPLHLAAGHCKDPEAVKLLLESGADIEALTEDYRQTPLHFAAISSRTPAVVKLLLDNGANLMACTDDGKTPLHYAVQNNQSSAMMKLLLGAKDNETDAQNHQRLKALAKVKSKDGHTAFDYVKKSKNPQGTDVYQRLKDLTSD